MPASRRGSVAANSRTQSPDRLPGDAATNATERPSGDTASCVEGTWAMSAANVVFTGGTIENRTTFASGVHHWRSAAGRTIARAVASAAVENHHSERRRLRVDGRAAGVAPELEDVDAIQRNWRLTSAVLCHRSSGSFARQPCTI